MRADLRNPSPAMPLPPDVRLMNGVAALMALGVLLVALAGALQWMTRLHFFAVRAIQVEGDVNRNSAASLRANAVPHLRGSFLSMNLQQTRRAFEAVPWVRKAVVQRVWPNLIKVRLEEHQPAAYWETKVEGADAASEASEDRMLVNSFGEVFQANLGDVEDEDLPLLSGPAGASAHMLEMWKQVQSRTQLLDDIVERLDLSGRGSWRATLEKGVVIELGRGSDDEVLARYAQFVASITQLTSRYRTALLSADLRHNDGYAVRLAGVSTTPNPQKAPKAVPKKN